jgi:hypothetical protein
MGEAAEIASRNVKEQVTDLLLQVEAGRLELRSDAQRARWQWLGARADLGFLGTDGVR